MDSKNINKLEILINQINIGVIIIDNINNISFINTKAIELLKQSTEMPVYGCNINALFPSNQQNKLNRLLQKKNIKDAFDIFSFSADSSKLKIELKAYDKQRCIMLISDIGFFTDYSDKLEKENFKLNNIICALSDYVLLFDDQFIIKNVWTQSDQLFFYPKNFVVDRKITDIIKNDFAVKIENEVKEILLGAKERNLEYQHPIIQDIWLSANLSSIWVGDEQFVACVVRDITGNKLNMEYLQHNTSKLENLVDNTYKELELSKSALGLALKTTQVATWQFFPEDNRLLLDQKYMELISDGEIIKIEHIEDLLRYIDNSCKQKFVEDLNNAIINHSELNTDIKIITPQKHVKWLHGKGHFYKDAKGNYTCLMGSTIDVTEQKNTEIQYRTVANKYKMLMNSISQASALHEVIYDSNGIPADIKYVEVNRNFEKLLNVKANDVVGHCCKELLNISHKKIVDSFIDVAVTGIAKNFNNYFPEINKYFNFYVYKTDKNQVVSLIADITSKKMIENELFNTHKELNEANKLKSVILGNVNHELRSPLNGILGFAQMMEREVKNEEHKEFLGYIIESAERLKRTLDGLISLTDFEYGHLEIKKEKTNIVEFIRSIYYSLESIVKNKNLKLGFNTNTEVVEFETDLNLLNQVLMSLVDNAIKYTNEGEISLIVNLDEYVRVFKIIVRDTGCGIDSADFEKIFEPFRQADEGIKRNYGGLGLGLTQAREIVQMLGGNLYVESEVKKGSSFIIEFKY